MFQHISQPIKTKQAQCTGCKKINGKILYCPNCFSSKMRKGGTRGSGKSPEITAQS